MSIRAISQYAHSDPARFEAHLNRAGLVIVGRKDFDPLRRSIQQEAVGVIAGCMGEDVDDAPRMTPYQEVLAGIAESAGYLVTLDEGMNQMPGTWADPVIQALRHGDDEGDEQPGGDGAGGEGEEGAPPPDAGGAPPPPGGAPPPPM